MDSYEKKYKEALERAKAMIKVAADQDEAIGFANTIFPELKESEDEKIRKGIIRNLEYLANRAEGFVKDELKERITWLEKQGEQNKNYKTMIVKFICKKDWHGIGNYYYGKKYNGYPCEKEQKGYDIYDDNHVPTFCDEDFIDEYFNIVTEEKQGEQKPVFEIKTPEESLGIDSATYNEIVDECIYGEQKSTDKVKPKFKIGDWITNGDYTWKIVEIKPLDYILQSQDGNIVDDTISYVDEQFHSFTIEDAKNGDVLSDGTTIFIFEGSLLDGSMMSYCDYDTDSGESDAFCPFSMNLICSKITPATKEQRDLLFQKMHEAGYEWDAEKKELKKINSYCQENCKGFQEIGKCFTDGECKAKREAEQKPTDEDMKEALRTEYEKGRADAIAEMQKPVDCTDCTNSKGCINCENGNMKETLVQKLAWNEEDDLILETIIDHIIPDKPFIANGFTDEELVDWLKSLKDRVQPQPKWSEEDDKKLEWLCRIIHSCKVRKGISLAEESEIGSWVDKWLNYAPQSQWNPSDEQIKAIRLARSFVTDDFGEHNTLSEILIELEAQLKELKQ